MALIKFPPFSLDLHSFLTRLTFSAIITIIIIIIKGKIFIRKPQVKSYLQSTCCYKKSNQFIKTLSTIPSLENKNNPIYNK